ncbi:phospholipase A [Winogradskyella bathintestinalis]|uniref:Phosphatidylcholine 1-acylhydrolase n=1 Tax=Winogradskyella bathintestinalis TaxID=3035208 RepID=A0ABT7ZT66_9FLAO|nr:phospholipase A [Winogradskyella bathintestinalis]MDN3492163.1 phospholipase A [Winogradskyella bathintestinalis]
MKQISFNQSFIKLFGLIITLFVTISGNSQAYTQQELNDSIAKQPYFSIHKDNYFITGVPTNKTIGRNTADAKYQISFKQILTRSELPWNTYLFLTYTQKAFWNIYEESFPFSDINFNPSIAVGKAFYDKDDKLKGIGTLAFEHESNGRDSIFSRSWNRLSLEYTTNIAKNTIGRFKVWVPFAYKKGNSDLLEYTGLGQINLSHIVKPDKLFFDFRFRKGLNLDFKGSVRTRIYFNPFDNNISNQYLMLEWFVGQAEGLLNYQQSQSMVRIGYVIRTNEFKWLRGK